MKTAKFYKAKKINKNKIRRPIYVGVSMVSEREAYIAIKDAGKIKMKRVAIPKSNNPHRIIWEWLDAYVEKNNVKIVAAGIGNGGSLPTKEQEEELGSHFWLKDDIVPYVYRFDSNISARKKAEMAAVNVGKHFKNHHEVDIHLDDRRKVMVSHLVRLEDYEHSVSSEEFARLRELANLLKEQKGSIHYFSATPRGGGVALMRHALIRLFRQLDIEAHWYVMSADKKVFNITKRKFHNVLQGVADPKEELTTKDKEMYEKWIQKNVKRFTPVFKKATTIVIDDPQPSGMISYIKKINPRAKIIYRSHIHIESDLIDKKNTPQNRTWKFLWKNISKADFFVSHPIDEFIPPQVDRKKIVLMGATTDELDGLNKHLNKEQIDYYLKLFNQHLAENGQKPLDVKRDYIIQIARFDPSKGIPDVLMAYAELREKLATKGWKKNRIPQLVIVGHGAIDDPEGVPIYKQTLNSLKTDLCSAYADDIKVARLHHNDQILNALISKSKIVLQLSHREGFEVKVSEALVKGKPVIAYRVGGIPLQIENIVTGYLVKIGQTDTVARRMYTLLKYDGLYEVMSSRARSRVKRASFTISNAIRWLELATGKQPPPPLLVRRAFARFLVQVGVPQHFIIF